MTKLLLCDDDESNRLTTSALLEDEGYEVELASSYAEGHAKLTAPGASYGLLIFDYELGDGFGSALASVARGTCPGARLLLLTGADEVDSSSVDAVVRKGGGFEALLAAIRGARPGG